MRDRIVVLAPAGAHPSFGSFCADSDRWDAMLAGACRARAAAYLADGAIRPEDLDAGGGFHLPIDDSSWHLLSVDDHDNVLATVRMTVIPMHSGRRRGRLPHVGESLHRGNPRVWGHRGAAERFITGLELAFGQSRPDVGIIGGWAIRPDCELTTPGIAMALGAWALSRLVTIGGALCVASERHDAHGQLVRTGAVPIANVEGEPLYFDSAYGCKVGLLGFRTFGETKALRRKVDRMEAHLRASEVVLRGAHLPAAALPSELALA